MSLKYEPSSEPLRISLEPLVSNSQIFLGSRDLHPQAVGTRYNTPHHASFGIHLASSPPDFFIGHRTLAAFSPASFRNVAILVETATIPDHLFI